MANGPVVKKITHNIREHATPKRVYLPFGPTSSNKGKLCPECGAQATSRGLCGRHYSQSYARAWALTGVYHASK